MILKKNVRNHFNRQAKNYDQYARIQRELADWVLEVLNPVPLHVARILEIGCGTGYLTRKVLEAFPSAAVVAIDIAPAMLELAGERTGSPDRLLLLEHDVECPLPAHALAFGSDAPAGFDLIISSGTLQWIERPAETLRLLARHMRPGGRLHAGIFGAGTFEELRHAFAAASEGKGSWSHGPEMRSVEEWDEILRSAGLEDAKVFNRRVRETYPSVQRFLRGVRQSGANNASASEDVCRRPSVVRAMMDLYEERYSTQEGVYATWEWISVSANGAAPRLLDGTGVAVVHETAFTE